ncbi:hypothetical protein ACFYQT_39930 [Streptomyces tibetensis]|uniref:DUF3040 domain-containing protein n=1 Tax=Streptomyces tibetensis TaxID=2382123 RepID=A0ABW6N8G1_9ACTN
MNSDRVNELRALLRANRPEIAEDTALRDAIARQDAAMRAHREPYSAFRKEIDRMDSGPSIARTAVPVALGLGVFAAIVLTDGTEDLSWVRFLIATLAFWAVTGVSVLAARHWSGD